MRNNKDNSLRRIDFRVVILKVLVHFSEIIAQKVLLILEEVIRMIWRDKLAVIEMIWIRTAILAQLAIHWAKVNTKKKDIII